MTADTFEYCDTHCDMWEPGCERCEACSQHHNQMDVETWLAIIDRRAHPPDGGPKTHGLITIDTNQYDKFQMQAFRIKELEEELRMLNISIASATAAWNALGESEAQS